MNSTRLKSISYFDRAAVQDIGYARYLAKKNMKPGRDKKVQVLKVAELKS